MIQIQNQNGFGDPGSHDFPHDFPRDFPRDLPHGAYLVLVNAIMASKMSSDEDDEFMKLVEPLEVLFEYEGCRKVLQLTRSDVCSRISKELCGLGLSGAKVSFTSSTPSSAETNFFLQRYSKQWDTFLNITSIDQICQKDRLTVVAKPTAVKV